MKYSIIIPVFNRPEEVEELLASLEKQTNKDWEVIVVEDGSERDCKAVVDKYQADMSVRYFKKSNSGPGDTRNYGAERAQGEYLLIVDSDVILPEQYIESIDAFLATNRVDAFGGPDRAHESFTDVQKAINYSMTSFFTTGGIRGGKKKLDTFYPRSFNMGIRKEVYHILKGFRRMRFGEDVDFSMRIVEAGYKTALIPEAYVFHKRRTDWRKFYRQVYNSGIARINLTKLHPGSLKLVHLLPAAFTVGVFGALLVGFWYPFLWMLLLLYALMVWADSYFRNRNVNIAFLSIVAAFVQLMGYGMGFLAAFWKRIVLKEDDFQAFNSTFYK